MDADCGVHKMAGGLACSNGLGWSPDNRTMYVTAQFACAAESAARRVVIELATAPDGGAVVAVRRLMPPGE